MVSTVTSPLGPLQVLGMWGGGRGCQRDFLGCEILAKRNCSVSMKDAGIFLACKKHRDFFGVL